MAKISLDLIAGNNIKFLSVNGVLDKDGKIVYCSDRKGLPESHGRFDINDVYKQIVELAIEKGFVKYQVKIKIKHG